MSLSPPYAQGQDELQSRINKINRERDVIVKLLRKWTARAVAEAEHASSVSKAENYAAPFAGGFATLDAIFRAFYQVHAFLSNEGNFAITGVPLVGLCADANTHWHSAVTNDDAEASPQDTDECYLSDSLPSLGGRSSDKDDVDPESSPDPAMPSDGESEGSPLPATPTASNAGAASAEVASPGPTSHPAPEVAPHPMSPPMSGSSGRGATHTTAPAAPTKALGTETLLNAQPSAEDDAGLSSDPRKSQSSGEPKAIETVMVAERPVQDEFTATTPRFSTERPVQGEFTATTPRSSNPSLPARTEDSGDRRCEGDLPEGADGPCRHSTASESAPKPSPHRREEGKAGGSEACSCSERLGDRADVAAVGGVIEGAVSRFAVYYDVPPAKPVELGAVMKVFVSFYKTPYNFWLQLESSMQLLEALTTSLSEHCSSIGLQAAFDVRVGMSCAAQFGRDKRWRRARILKALPGRFQVLYFDYGNEELVELDCLRPLDESEALLPALAVHCTIPQVASLGSTGVWPLAARRKFQNMLKDAGELQARFQRRDDQTGGYVVDVLDTPAAGQARVNLSKGFLSECVDTMTPMQVSSFDNAYASNFVSTADLLKTSAPQTAVPPADTAPAVEELPVPRPSAPPLAAARPCVERSVQIHPPVQPEGDTFPVLITVIVSPTEFYVIPQVEDDLEKKMEDMQKRLAASAVASYPPTFNEVEEGTCWGCRYERDGNWYRVRVTKIAPEGPHQQAQVYLVDFGDHIAVPVSDLRPLPAHLAELPAFAHCMALSLVAPRDLNGEWDKEAIDFFAANTGLDTVLEARRKGRHQLGFETVTDVMLTNTSRKPKISPCEMSLTEPYAQGQGELQSNLNKVYRDRDSIVNLLRKWTARADAAAKQASSVSEVENYAVPLTRGFATLDDIFRALYQVQMFLNDEAIFAVTAAPSVDLRADANTAWGSAVANDYAETPPQDTDECFLSGSFLFLDGRSSDKDDVDLESFSDPATTSDGESEGSPLPVTPTPSDTGAASAPIASPVPTSHPALEVAPHSMSPPMSASSGTETSLDAQPSTEDDGGLPSDSRMSPSAPEASLPCRENGKAKGSEPYTSGLLGDRTDVAAVGGVTERAVLCCSGHYYIPPADPVELRAVMKVFVSFYKTPHDFWLQRESSGELLESSTTSVAEHSDAMGPPAGFDVRVWMSSAAQFGRDKRWHRARIVKPLPGRFRVLCVHYSNQEPVRLHNQRPLDKSQESLPALALYCAKLSMQSI
ncbi:uncharacterized protein LOC144142979 [Haemaphysalis longicornis]